MHLVKNCSNDLGFLKMYDLVWHGLESEARGQKTRNVRNLAIVLDASEPILTSFDARKLNLDYCKKEWLWYIRADKYDSSIEKHAKMWLKLKQADGSYNSNYGQYIFAKPQGGGDSQFWYCYKQLLADPGTRRAAMVLLKQDHLYPENTDTVCTYAINFCIEDHRLHMTVMMRSNDVIYGFTNDAFCFGQLYTFMFKLLKAKMPDLQYGTYTHMANSMHVYERHYDMIQDLINGGLGGYEYISVPDVTAQEVSDLIVTGGKSLTGDYSFWLNS